MTREERLPQCDEKFLAHDREIKELKDKKQDKPNGGSMGWTVAKWVSGLFVTAVVMVILPSIATNVIANDKDTRAREKKMEDKYDRMIYAQLEVNKQLLVAITEIKSDLKYLKRVTDVEVTHAR